MYSMALTFITIACVKAFCPNLKILFKTISLLFLLKMSSSLLKLKCLLV